MSTVPIRGVNGVFRRPLRMRSSNAAMISPGAEV